MSGRVGWHLGFGNVIHLIDDRKDKQFSWGKCVYTYCDIITDGFGGYDPDHLIEMFPNMRLCKTCIKAEAKRLQTEAMTR